jgi:hypothetical protein
MAKHVGPTTDLVRVQARSLALRGETRVSFVYRYRTRDVTMNLPVQQALQRVAELVPTEFHQANLHTPLVEVQLSFSKRGKALLRTMNRPAGPPMNASHLVATGVAGGEAAIEPASSGAAAEPSGFHEPKATTARSSGCCPWSAPSCRRWG